MKPYLGAIVLLTLSAASAAQLSGWGGAYYKEGDKVPAVVTAIWGPSCVNVAAIPDGAPIARFTSLSMADPGNPTSANTWSWPEIPDAPVVDATPPAAPAPDPTPVATDTPAEAPVAAGEEEHYGSFLSSLLTTSLPSVLLGALVQLALNNEAQIATDAARLTTPSEGSVRSALKRLGISDEVHVQAILLDVRAWGTAGGSVLTAIAAAKAGL